MEKARRLQHAFTVDVEDYFHSEDPDPAGWDRHAQRLEGSTRTVLELSASAGVRGTFFVLGWVATRMPHLVREIAAAGHEVASHGSNHQFVYRQSADEFREDVRAARERLEDLVGHPVRGYRAPYFSIVGHTPWAHEVLVETGHAFSSSVFPGSNPRYGIPHHPRGPTRVTTPSGSLWEFPVTTFASRVGCGGVYFRALPYSFFVSWLRQLERGDQPAVFYIHPWETDPGIPRVQGSLGLRLRHTIGLRGAAPRLGRLLSEFSFGPLGPRVPTSEPVSSPAR
jgi:polysaccharide deacetylase family protein (PEP-CTERM system associated)